MSINYFGILNRAKLTLAIILIVSSSVQASELLVNDNLGVPYLRVDAAEGSVFDLNVVFTDSTIANEAELSLTSQNGEIKKVTVNPSDVTKGVLINNVILGEYVVNTNSSDLKIKRVNVSDSQTANVVKPGEETIGTTAYVVGAAAVVGGVVAVSAGRDGLDVFGGSNSSGNSTRSGSGTSGGSGTAVSVAEPRAGVSVQNFDPNFPTNNPGFDRAPDGNVTNNPAPPAVNPVGGGGAAATPTPNPTVIPAPPFTNPMTPS
jgi:hypothetical protein